MNLVYRQARITRTKRPRVPILGWVTIGSQYEHPPSAMLVNYGGNRALGLNGVPATPGSTEFNTMPPGELLWWRKVTAS